MFIIEKNSMELMLPNKITSQSTGSGNESARLAVRTTRPTTEEYI